MAEFICYCFEHTPADIRSDVLAHNGQSEILTKIITAKKQGSCQCAEKHPEGR